MSDTSQPRFIAILPFAAVAAFAAALYVYVLKLPFFWDDMFMLLRLQGMPWERLWTSAAGYLYYRPLYLSTLKLSELIFGWPQPVFMRALNVALHAADSVLVALLAWSLSDGKGKRIAAIAAGSLFAAFPFSFEVMPLAANVYQPLITLLVTGAVLCYANFKLEAGASRWLWASLALALIGSFTCEYGVIIPALIVLVEVIFRRRRADSKFSFVPLIYFLFAAAYLAAWVAIPKSRAEPPLILQGLGPILQNMPVTALYYLQGLTYPLQPLAWPLVRATGMSRELGVGIVAIVTLAGIAALFASNRRTPLLAFALVWFAVAIAPAWPTLNADYTLNGPRLLYMPSVGAALLWGMAVAILWTQAKRLWKAMGVMVLVATLAPSVAFLYGMANLITVGARLTTDVSRTVAATPPDEPVLVVNFPSWIGKREAQTTFALGSEGMSLLPGYSSMRDLVLLNTRQERNVTSVTFTNTIKEWKYDQRLGGLVNWNKLVKAMRAAQRVWMVEYLPDTLRLSEAGFIQQSAQPDPPQAIFDERIGVRLVNDRVTADELRVELAWTTPITVDRQLTAFVHVYDPQGKLIAQQDGYPMLGLYPPWIAQQGQVVHDVRHVALPANLPAGRYTVGVGVYDLETGQRVAALSPTGARFENDVYLMLGFDVQSSGVESQNSNR